MNEFIHKMLKVSRAMTRRKSIITLFNYPSGQKKKRGGITSLVIIFVITIVILIISVEKTLLVVFHNR